jgi:hypothetical protein
MAVLSLENRGGDLVTWLDWALSAVFAALVYVVFVQRLNLGAPGSARPPRRENAHQRELLLITGQRQAEHTTSGER